MLGFSLACLGGRGGVPSPLTPPVAFFVGELHAVLSTTNLTLRQAWPSASTTGVHGLWMGGLALIGNDEAPVPPFRISLR